MRTPRARGFAPFAGLLVAMLLAGCQGGSPVAQPTASAASGAGTQVGIVDPDDIDPARLAPLEGMGPCASPPEQPPGLDAGDLPLPAEAILTGASVDGALQSAQGYSTRTPVEIMVDYLRLEGWTVLNAEDEVFESEVLVERDGVRVFVKSQAVCARGSAFVMFASDDEALVPTPAGPTP